MRAARFSWWRHWSLRRQLAVGVSAVVMVVLTTVGLIAVLTLRTTITGIVDSQLTSSADGFSHAVDKYRSTPLPNGELPAPDTMKPLNQLIGQAPGNIVVLVRDGRVVDSAFFGDGEATPAPPAALTELADHSWGTPQSQVVWIPGYGKYLLTSRPGGPAETLVTAASLRPASAAATHQTVIVVVLTALGLLVTFVATLAMVRTALRPLRRVAATAAEVTTLPLSRDQYAITPRVPDRDTNRRTEVGVVGETLNRLLDHVERALTEVAASDRRMRQFITDASHELRTPLAAIHGYAELTRQDSSVLPETTEYSLARIEAESTRMNELVADLLLLARLDEGQDLERADVDLAEIAMDAVNDASVSSTAHRWRTEVPDDPVWVVGDRAKIHQALVNLLSNARQHTPDGTEVTTTITRDPDSREVVLTVTDDGPGIEANLVPHLFERFVRADKARSRQAGNFGLGLPIAQSIVEAHGGSISADSASGATSFTVRLPLSTRRSADEPGLAMSAR